MYWIIDTKTSNKKRFIKIIAGIKKGSEYHYLLLTDVQFNLKYYAYNQPHYLFLIKRHLQNVNMYIHP